MGFVRLAKRVRANVVVGMKRTRAPSVHAFAGQPVLLYSDDSYQKDIACMKVKRVNVCSYEHQDE